MSNDESVIRYAAEKHCQSCGAIELVETNTLQEALSVYTQVWYCPSCGASYDE